MRGDGVVGEQPWVRPGEDFEYTSGAVLETALGTMRGSYQMVADDGTHFDADIPLFMLTDSADAALMATWAIGDIQGCYDELSRLIEKLRFDPARDTLWFCGDLVNRGGQSLAVLRLVKSLGERAIVVLGNHDLSLLAIAERKREDQARVNPELREVLFAPDRDELLDWLRARPLLHVDRTLEFRAGACRPRSALDDRPRPSEVAREIEERLRGEGNRRLLKQMFGNKPDLWNPKLRGIDRWRAGINVFTRMRYCDVRGRIAFNDKGAPGHAATRPVSVVRGARPDQARPPHGLRTLVHARPLRRPRRLRDRHRLRLGWRTDRAAPGQRGTGVRHPQVRSQAGAGQGTGLSGRWRQATAARPPVSAARSRRR